MYFFNYFNGVAKAVLLMAGLNGYGETIDLQEAYHLIDLHVLKIQKAYALEVDQNLVDEAKNEIFKLSYKRKTLADLVEKVATLIEQRVIFGSSNDTLKLPKILENLRGIYHFKANLQLDGTSCGYRTTATAKALDDCLEAHGSLDLERINEDSNTFLQQMFADFPLMLLEPKHINYFACNKKYCGLNTKSFPQLVNACKIKTVEDFETNKFREVCQNKLHVINLWANYLSFCCFSNKDLYLKKSAHITSVLQAIMNNHNDFITQVLSNLSKASQATKILNKEDLQEAQDAISEIDWDYIKFLIKDLQENKKMKILSFLADYKFALIPETRAEKKFKKQISPTMLIENAVPELTELLDYSNNKKLLTIVNVAWAIASNNNRKIIGNSSNEGQIGELLYLKALSDHFKNLGEEKKNGALHFACYIGGIHWILISVINLADKKPVIAIVDSMNSPLISHWAHELGEHTIDELIEWVNSYEEEPDKSKLLYILFLYDLFINGNTNAYLEQPLHKALGAFSKASRFNMPSLSETQQMEQALIASLADEKTASKANNGKKKKHSLVAKKNGFHPVPDLNGDVVRNGLDVCPNEKGKEKSVPKNEERQGKNGYHSGNECEKTYGQDGGSGS